MKKQLVIITLVAAMLGWTGCLRDSDVSADAELKRQAYAAYEAGQTKQARRLVAKANRYNVPRAQLWRRTLELQIATKEGTQQGELRRLMLAWGEQRKDWSREDRINAELTLAETLQGAYAADWLYDLDATDWPVSYRTRYNLLRSNLQQNVPMLRDDTVARWRLAIRDLYFSGDIKGAAREAERCATSQRNVEAALIAAKLYNELNNMTAKENALKLALSYSGSAATRREVASIRTAPAGTKTDL